MNIFWFRKDLRLNDNIGLFKALKNGDKVLGVFIFDDAILHELDTNDPRVSFIYDCLASINKEIVKFGGSLLIKRGDVLSVWQEILANYSPKALFYNRDYEPYALDRDKKVQALFEKNQLEVHSFKDQVYFEPHEVLKKDGTPYTVYTPYKRKWLEKFHQTSIEIQAVSQKQLKQFVATEEAFPCMEDLGIERSTIKVKDFSLEDIKQYADTRDFPSKDAGTYLGPHLRFGTVGIRTLIKKTLNESEVLLSEYIWRSFFKQILYHFPHVVGGSFKKNYDAIPWRNNEEEFQKWCQGKTGYPIVDAGMRQLNATGYMHNRVRMITASFLIKHLLIDWRWGEAYFAKKLLDFDLSANNGNWQWAASCGCDAVPYFRIFNPTTQEKKFDPKDQYIKKWIPEYSSDQYINPIVEHKFARQRALDTYKEALSQGSK